VVRHRARLLQEIIVPDWWASTGHNPTCYATGLDHQAIISAAYLDGCQTLLVFEDDAVLAEGFDAAYAAAVADLPQNWTGLWLGGVDYSPPVVVTPPLVGLRKRTQTHAYLLSRRGMHRLYSHVTHER